MSACANVEVRFWCPTTGKLGTDWERCHTESLSESEAEAMHADLAVLAEPDYRGQGLALLEVRLSRGERVP